MAYEIFLECLLQNLQAALGEEFHFILRPLPRNNGVTLDGLTLQGPGAHLAPTIYLNPYYQKLIHGSSLESIVEEILQLYQTTPPPASLTAESVIDFEYLKDKVMFRMIHTASNQVLLSDVPHIPYLDLSIIFFLSLERTDTRSGHCHDPQQSCPHVEGKCQRFVETGPGKHPTGIPSRNSKYAGAAAEHGPGYLSGYL